MSLPRRPLKEPSFLVKSINKSPFLYFGAPFILTIVLGSFVLSNITQTRYDYKDAKTAQVSQEDSMKMSKGRRKVDLREEYIRLQGEGELDFENKRVPRLPGQAEWGDAPK